MDIRKAIEYAQVSLQKMLTENEVLDKRVATKQLDEMMWMMYQRYDSREIHMKSQNIINDLELG